MPAAARVGRAPGHERKHIIAQDQKVAQRPARVRNADRLSRSWRIALAAPAARRYHLREFHFRRSGDMGNNATKLYTGNVPWEATENDLRIFYGDGDRCTVKSVSIVADRDTGRPRGFAFVELSSTEECDEAIEELNDTEMGGRRIVVNYAKEKPRTDRRESRR
jgi:hypothetical protein